MYKYYDIFADYILNFLYQYKYSHCANLYFAILRFEEDSVQ